MRAPAPSTDVRWHGLPADEVLSRLSVTPTGLTAAEAADRLRRNGPNRLARTPPTPVHAILLRQVASVVVALLAAAALVAFLAGDRVEAAAIGAVLLINTALGFAVELRARRAMESLLRYQALTATVVREGEPIQVAADALVTGDVIVLQAGDAVPADARVLEAADLRTVEAPLTGESLPVAKSPDPAPGGATLPDRTSMVYSGTSVATGSARAAVVATGVATELGRIGGLVGQVAEERTPLERRLDALGRRLVLLTLAVAVVVGGTGILRGGSIGLMIETAIALAIAAVPEGLPAVATIALAVGLRRMARRNALVRNLHAVEALGSATVVCTDKTGTLTAGEMTVTALRFPDRTVEVTGIGYAPEGVLFDDGEAIDPARDEGVREALEVALLSARADVVLEGDRWVVRGDPTDAALVVLARKGGLDAGGLHDRFPSIGELPFTSRLRLSASFHEEGGGAAVLAAVKGGPVEVLERCAAVRASGGREPLDDAVRSAILGVNDTLAGQGLRVIALARGPVPSADAEHLRDLDFLCLTALMDPPAEGVRDTIDQLGRAGIRTLMITGDQARTAAAVAAELGLPAGGVLSGVELDRMSDPELRARLRDTTVFSRVSPERKLDIVRLLQEDGEIVAMIGDGVNDAAALKQANAGVAMGGRGTDVAREVAAVVLRDDRFVTIGAAVEEGRVIYDNIRKFIFYLFSCNLAEVLVLFAAGLAGLPLPLLPLQILWLNLVTDTFPALALALEPGEPGVMARPPRDPAGGILSRRFARAIGFYAVLITGVTFAAFLWGLRPGGEGYEHAVTLSFMTLALAQLFHLGNARSTGPVLSFRRASANRFALVAVAVVLILQILAVQLPPLAALLDLRPLRPADWALVGALSVVPAGLGQILRLYRVRRITPRRAT